jgi:hypothetical protein
MNINIKILKCRYAGSVSFVFVIALLFIFINCVTNTEDEFTENKTKWQNYGITNYSFQIENTGFLPANKRVITVKNNVVDSVFLIDDSLAVADSLLYLYSTIDGLFVEVNKNINSKAKTTVHYNSLYGYPEHVYRDYGEEGDGFMVSNFSLQ